MEPHIADPSREKRKNDNYSKSLIFTFLEFLAVSSDEAAIRNPSSVFRLPRVRTANRFEAVGLKSGLTIGLVRADRLRALSNRVSTYF